MQSSKTNTASLKETQISNVLNNESVSPAQFKHQSAIARLLNSLSINQKIAWGYALVMGITVVGTVAGFFAGDYYQKQAFARKRQELHEIRLLNNLQATLLQVQAHQHRLILLRDVKLISNEYAYLLNNSVELTYLWDEVIIYSKNAKYSKNNQVDGLLEFIQKYAGVTETYTQQITALLKQVNVSNLQPERISVVQKKLLDFNNSYTYLRLHEASEELDKIVNTSYQDLQQADMATIAAQKLREKIIAVSMLLSVAIAFLLAMYTSRAIARPLQAVNDVAQQVTQESNFDLQAPVTTTDEVGMLASSLNQLIQRVNNLLAEQKAEASRQLIQSEKMSSLGRMIAGVAHEINNPINFIYGNIQHTNTYFQDLLVLLDVYQTKFSDDEILTLSEEIDLEFIKEDLPKLLQSMQVGSTRVREIVLSLKNFSRLDESEVNPVDLHACIDSTLLILNNRIKKDISIAKNYGDLPQIEGYAGSLYQVFMNILSNAIDALEDGKQPNSPEIVITTQRREDNWIEIKISDNGSGILPEYQTKIFEAFFTTKPIGIGTGLGLSISHQIIVEKHHGRLTCESEPDKGTTFAIALPIKHLSKAQTSD